MSPSPDVFETVVHLLDLAYGLACAAFIAVAVAAVAAELLERRRHHAPLVGAWPPSAGAAKENVR